MPPNTIPFIIVELFLVYFIIILTLKVYSLEKNLDLVLKSFISITMLTKNALDEVWVEVDKATKKFEKKSNSKKRYVKIKNREKNEEY